MDYKNTNPAVIKAMLIQMDKQTFINHALEIRHLLIHAEVGTTYRAMLLNLYSFCRHHYKCIFYKKYRYN